MLLTISSPPSIIISFVHFSSFAAFSFSIFSLLFLQDLLLSLMVLDFLLLSLLISVACLHSLLPFVIFKLLLLMCFKDIDKN